MTKQLTIILAFTVVMLLLTACGVHRYVYSPPPATVTYFKEKGDNKISAVISTGSNDGNSRGNTYNKGYDIQAGFALSNFWFVSGTYFHRKEGESADGNYNYFDTSTINYKRNILEVGGGCFMPLNYRRTSTFNLYAAYGLGKFAFNDYGLLNGTQYDRNFSNNIFKYSLQFGFNFMPSDYLHISLTGKFSLVHYGVLNTNYTPNELSYFNLTNISSRTTRFFEPTINTEIGLPQCKWLWLDMSLTLCTDNNYVNKREVNASIGLSVNLNSGRNFKKRFFKNLNSGKNN
jgi:hypothetical protein